MRDTDPNPVTYNGLNVAVFWTKFAEWQERVQAQLAEDRRQSEERMRRIFAPPPQPISRIVENGLTPELNIPINQEALRPRLLDNLRHFVLWLPVNGREQTKNSDEFKSVILPYIDEKARQYDESKEQGIPTFHRSLIQGGIAREVVSRMSIPRRPRETTRAWFRRMWWMMYESTKKYKEENYYAYISFTPRPAIPPLVGIRDGEINCVVSAVLKELSKQKQTDKVKSKVRRLNELSTEILARGANNDDFQRIAKISTLNLMAFDRMNNLWHEFKTSAKNKNLSLTISGGHAYEKWEPPAITPAHNIVWRNSYSISTILKYPVAKVMISGEDPTAIITKDTIYKTTFPGYEQHPECFSEAGVGRKKILEYFKDYRSEIDTQALLDAVPKNLYIRNKQSNPKNTKQDMNEAYRNHSQNPYYRGIPESLTVYDYESAKPELAEYAGLIYITSLTKANPHHIHFSEGINTWYPLETADWATACKLPDGSPCCSFAASRVAIGRPVRPDYSKFTKNEFRKMVGRCASRESTELWATRDENEYKMALHSLADRVVKHERIDHDTADGEHQPEPLEVPLYFVYYRAETQPWSLPVVPISVKHNHNIRVYSILNELADQGIRPVAVKVDSIEVEPAHKDSLMKAISKVKGGWKAETPRESGGFYDEQEADMEQALELPRPDPHPLPPARAYTRPEHIDKYTHIAGEAGCAKTQWIVDSYKNGNLNNSLFCSPTGKASRNLRYRMRTSGIAEPPKVYTAHKLFGIQCRHSLPRPSSFDRVVIEECSMIGELTMDHINKTLKSHCKTEEDFGGKSIILVGDFGQLQPVQDTPFNHSEWYSIFTIRELLINYRQKDDPLLFKLCHILRGVMSEERAKELVAILNGLFYYGKSRTMPTNTTLNDVFIAGTNCEVGIYNEAYPLAVGNKAMLRRSIGEYRNGDEGIITAIKDNQITLQFADGGSITATANDDRTITQSQGQTVHLCQGDTKTGNVIINPSRLFTENHLYVALTRATTRANIVFTHPITLEVMKKTCLVEDEYDEPIECQEEPEPTWIHCDEYYDEGNEIDCWGVCH
jgi:hypothetical protein